MYKNILAVGAWSYSEHSRGINDSGAAYVYQLESNRSASFGKLTAPDAKSDVNFGVLIAIREYDCCWFNYNRPICGYT